MAFLSSWFHRPVPDLPALEEAAPEPEDERGHWDYLEDVFSETYKKEIDQEENIWRTITVFVAAIALELTALNQLRADMVRLSGIYLWVCGGECCVFVISLVMMAFFLIQAVRPRRFSYLAPETDLLAFAKGIEQDFLADGFTPAAVSAAVKREIQNQLLEQMATATTKRRRIIKQQAQYRGRAVWPLFISIAMILLLFMSVVVGQYELLPRRASNELAKEACPSGETGSRGSIEESKRGLLSVVQGASCTPFLPQDACRYDWLDVH